MRRVFQDFVDRLAESVDVVDLRETMAVVATALELPRFAYLLMPRGRPGDVRLITTSPSGWIDHYVDRHYGRLDRVILRAVEGRPQSR